MSPFALAWRGFRRQPARSALGVAGVAIVGALLLDMLLLSRGLVVSFERLLDRVGYDVRVTATDSMIGSGPPIRQARETMATLEALPEIEEIDPLRFGRAVTSSNQAIHFLGASGEARRNWRLVEGRALDASPAGERPPLLINVSLADALRLRVGDSVQLRGACSPTATLAPVEFEVVGIVELAFDALAALSAVTTLEAMERTCGVDDVDSVDLLLVASRGGSAAAVEAIRRVRPDLHPISNRELVTRIERRDMSYFRQISIVLSTLTLFFAFLLVATLLTVSVNQRLGEVAALRALGFSRRRVVADLVWESSFFVVFGGLLSWPLGAAMARWLDGILRSMGEFPAELHFFVFQPHVILLHAGLILLTGVAAACYPVYLAARLPIAATLRREVVG